MHYLPLISKQLHNKCIHLSIRAYVYDLPSVSAYTLCRMWQCNYKMNKSETMHHRILIHAPDFVYWKRYVMSVIHRYASREIDCTQILLATLRIHFFFTYKFFHSRKNNRVLCMDNRLLWTHCNNNFIKKYLCEEV